jgi:hypothetical protein
MNMTTQISLGEVRARLRKRELCFGQLVFQNSANKLKTYVGPVTDVRYEDEARSLLQVHFLWVAEAGMGRPLRMQKEERQISELYVPLQYVEHADGSVQIDYNNDLGMLKLYPRATQGTTRLDHIQGLTVEHLRQYLSLCWGLEHWPDLDSFITAADILVQKTKKIAAAA